MTSGGELWKRRIQHAKLGSEKGKSLPKLNKSLAKSLPPCPLLLGADRILLYRKVFNLSCHAQLLTSCGGATGKTCFLLFIYLPLGQWEPRAYWALYNKATNNSPSSPPCPLPPLLLSTAPAKLQVSLVLTPLFLAALLKGNHKWEGERRSGEGRTGGHLGLVQRVKRPADNHHSGKLTAPLQGCLAKRQPGKKERGTA